MLKDLYKYLSMMLVAVFAAACTDLPEDSGFPDSEQSRYITFENFNVDTKVTNDDITDQVFAIWVFDAEHKTKGSPLFHGRLQYDDSESVKRWRLHNGTSYVDVEWGTGKHVFLAHTYWTNPALQDLYYSSASGNFYLPQNLSFLSYDEYTKDILYASAQTAEVDYKPVNLEFKHLFPSLKFVVRNNTDVCKTITDFEIRKFKAVCIGTPTASFQGTFMNLAPLQGFSEDYHYRDPDTDTDLNAGISLAPDETRVMFGSPVIVFPQTWDANESGDTYYTPKVSFKVDGVSNDFNFYTDFGLLTWEAGKQYTYTVNINQLEPDVTIEHVKDADGVLTHSAVKLVLNQSDAQLAQIKELNVRVLKDGVTYRNQTFATVSSNEITITEGDYAYLPKGDGYEVVVSYKFGDNDSADEVTVSDVSSPAPTYTLTLNVSATLSSCTVDKAVVSISDAVLSEVGLTAEGSYVLAIQGAESPAATSGSIVADNSTFMTDLTYTGKPTENGYYVIDISNISNLKFDGVSPSGVTYDVKTDCTVTEDNYVTYVPPAADPAKVGDYFYSDGTYSTDLVSGKDLVGIVFYVPDSDDSTADRPIDYDTQLKTACQEIDAANGIDVTAGDYQPVVGTHGLVVSTTPTQGQFFLSTNLWGTAVGYKYSGGRQSASYIKTGYANTQAFKTKDKNSNGCRMLGGLTTIAKASPWYMPTFAEMDELNSALGVINGADDEKGKLETAGMSDLPNAFYWTVTEADSGSRIATYKLLDKTYDDPYKSTSNAYALPIFAF